MTEVNIVQDTTTAAESDSWLAQAPEWNLWAFLAFGASLIFLIVSLILLFSVNSQQQRIDRAIQTLESAEPFPDRPSQMLAEARSILEDVEAAEARATGFLGLFEALAVAITVLGILATVIGVGAGVNLARTSGQLAEAQSKYESLQGEIQHAARNASLAQSLLPLARRQHRAGDLDGALKTYDRAIELDANNPVPHYHRGYILTQKNDLSEAEQALNRALKLDHSLVQAQAALGYVYRRMGDEFAAIIENDDRTADERNRARRERDALYDQAEEYLLLALTRFNRLVDDDSESWYGSLAGLYKRLGKYDKAKMYYSEARDITPQSSYPEMNLAIIKLKYEDDIDGAQANFRRVAKLARYETQAERDNYWALGDLLTAQLALGASRAEVESTLEEFVAVVPDDATDVLPRIIDTLDDIQTAYTAVDRETTHIEEVLTTLRELQATTR